MKTKKLTEDEQILKNLKEIDAERLKRDIKDLKAWVKEEFKGKVKKVKVLDKTEVLYCGWECDPYLWLVQLDKEVVVVGTNHGGYEIHSRGFLDDKAVEYSTLIQKYMNWMGKATK